MSASPYFRAAERVLAEAHKKAETYKGPCDECRWCKSTMLEQYCRNPLVKVAAFSLSDASAAEYITECDEQRDTSSIWGPVLCGPEGELFEPRFSWWRAIFGRKEADR